MIPELSPLALFFWLIVGHCLADYPLQGDFLSKAKNHRSPIRAANGAAFPWQIALGAHALIHAGFVALITGSVALGMAEFFVHCVIDHSTSKGERTYWQDQVLHLACKVLYVGLIVFGGGGAP